MTSLTALLPAIFLCSLIPLRRAEDDLSTVCSSVFHDASNSSLQFHFSYPGNERFRFTSAGYYYPRGLIRGEIPVHSSVSPSFSCMLIFTSSAPQATRLLVRVSDLQLQSDPLKCAVDADAIRIYSVIRGRLFLVREFCGNDNYAPAIITESNMAVVTVAFFDSNSERKPRKFHLKVEGQTNIFRSVDPPKFGASIPHIAHLSTYQTTERPRKHHYEAEYEWSKYLNQLSEWRQPFYSQSSSWTSPSSYGWNNGISNGWNNMLSNGWNVLPNG